MPSGRDKILAYLREHLGEWVHNQDLRNASGVNDTPRTIRLLKQQGWQIEVRGDGYNRLVSLDKKEPRGERKGISGKVRFETMSRDGFRCRACGRSADDGVKLQIDHITPVDWGGTNDPSNLQTLCEDCNLAKKASVDMLPRETMRRIMGGKTVESRIEALFDNFPNQDIPSTLIQIVSKGALDWQRALRRVRQRTGKKILPIRGRLAYRYFKEDVG